MKKYRTKISIPSLSTHLSEMANTLVVKCCIYDWEIDGSIPGTDSSGKHGSVTV